MKKKCNTKTPQITSYIEIKGKKVSLFCFFCYRIVSLILFSFPVDPSPVMHVLQYHHLSLTPLTSLSPSPVFLFLPIQLSPASINPFLFLSSCAFKILIGEQ